uniref:Uncharacterized protein n=1 Tax=Arundo donax TaxID=35708 RepID=A0A0A8YHR0_ARUDO
MNVHCLRMRLIDFHERKRPSRLTSGSSISSSRGP